MSDEIRDRDHRPEPREDPRHLPRGRAQWLERNLPPGRHASLALTALEESMHWANAAVACDTVSDGVPFDGVPFDGR